MPPAPFNDTTGPLLKPVSASSALVWVWEMAIGVPPTCDDRVCKDMMIEVERTPIGCEKYASGACGVRGCRWACRTSP
jgi:hypothetical protein